MVSNECHKRKRQVNQIHASGGDNFNGAEEVIKLYFPATIMLRNRCHGNETIIFGFGVNFLNNF